jgi:hypothetical protein
MCQELNVRYIPMCEEFSGGIRYFGDICHTRPKGMERKASIVYEHLLADLDTVLGGRKG